VVGAVVVEVVAAAGVAAPIKDVDLVFGYLGRCDAGVECASLGAF
jgi:hypothetical protein